MVKEHRDLGMRNIAMCCRIGSGRIRETSLTLSVVAHDTFSKDPHLGLAVQTLSCAECTQTAACSQIVLMFPSSPCCLAICYLILYGCESSCTLHWAKAARVGLGLLMYLTEGPGAKKLRCLLFACPEALSRVG